MNTYTAATDPRPVSPKQLGFLTKLFAELQVEATAYVRPRSVTEASELIEFLLALPKPAKVPAPEAKSDLITEAGMYSLNGDIFKATPRRSGSGFNVKRATPDGFVYVGGPYAVRGAVKLSQEDAAAYGATHGFCACCGKLLTDPESIAAGIGPVCLKRYF